MQSSTARFKASSAASFTPSLVTSNPSIPKPPPLIHAFLRKRPTLRPACDPAGTFGNTRGRR